MAETDYPRGFGALMDRNVPSQLDEDDLAAEMHSS
jgi:hypothetical protein